MDPILEIDIAFHGPGLIIRHKKGALYTSQVFGNFCYQVSTRGHYVPLDRTLPEFIPEPLEAVLRALLLNAPRLSPREADDVDQILARYHETTFLRVDRTMLAESGEAWVYVDVVSAGACPLQGSGPWKGVLVWPNSD